LTLLLAFGRFFFQKALGFFPKKPLGFFRFWRIFFQKIPWAGLECFFRNNPDLEGFLNKKYLVKTNTSGII